MSTRKLGFIARLEKRGFRASVVSAEHLHELREEIQRLHDEGLLYDDLYHQYENPFFNPTFPKSFPRPKSIIIVSTPQPMLRTKVHWRGKTLHLIIPPTYYDGEKIVREARRELRKALGPKRYRLVRATLPQKLLAVRSGLAKYGKNNITYVEGHGSFHRLTSFFTDYDSPVDFWQDKMPLPLCAKCTACMRACPTAAIGRDRFLIHVEKCLTYLNEKKAEHAFPKWVDRGAHNALIGCMRCQKACPYNRGKDKYEDRGEFSEEEVAYLLKGKYTGAKARKIERKLKRFGLDLAVFPRNLKALLENS